MDKRETVREQIRQLRAELKTFEASVVKHGVSEAGSEDAQWTINECRRVEGMLELFANEIEVEVKNLRSLSKWLRRVVDDRFVSERDEGFPLVTTKSRSVAPHPGSGTGADAAQLPDNDQVDPAPVIPPPAKSPTIAPTLPVKPSTITPPSSQPSSHTIPERMPPDSVIPYTDKFNHTTETVLPEHKKLYDEVYSLISVSKDRSGLEDWANDALRQANAGGGGALLLIALLDILDDLQREGIPDPTVSNKVQSLLDIQFKIKERKVEDKYLYELDPARFGAFLCQRVPSAEPRDAIVCVRKKCLIDLYGNVVRKLAVEVSKGSTL